MDLHEKGRKAFTLIELIIVFAIIVILTGVAVPFTAEYITERHVYNTAAQIQQDLLLVQNLAITHSSDNSARFRIRFYPTQNRYVIEASEDANLVSGQGKLIKRQITSTIGFPLFFNKNVPDSVVFGVKSCPPQGYLDVSFNNVGVPHTGGGHINIITQNGTKQAKVIVSIIGRVRIEWVKR